MDGVYRSLLFVRCEVCEKSEKFHVLYASWYVTFSQKISQF